jgi:hypothetical protein
LTPKEVVEVILATGHTNIQAVHPTTLMFTKEMHLSESGDCIIAVAADKATTDLSPEFKNALREPNAKLTIIIEAGELTEQITAYGSPKLSLTNAVDIVIRKSDYKSDRTLAIKADKSSKDLTIEFIDKLRNDKQIVKITLIARAGQGCVSTI